MTLNTTTGQQHLRRHIGPIRRWIIEHDDSWLFIGAYIGLAVVLSVWISLFWLVVVVAGHFLLECLRWRHAGVSGGRIGLLALWETKLDLALIAFGLALAAYLEFALGLVGVGNVARAGMHGVAKAPAWTRAIRGVLLSLDDAAQAVRVVTGRNGDEAGDDVIIEDLSPWRPARWALADHVAIWFGVTCLIACITAPWLLGHDTAWLIETLADELHPWPGR
jgi:hypothetical protein